MPWSVALHPEFDAEFLGFAPAVQDAILVAAGLLRTFGPQLPRPYCNTLKGSRFANMKELRCTLPDGEWRVAFAFDPRRAAILLVAGSKSGISTRRFYKGFIGIADKRFTAHLASLAEGRGS